MLADQVQGRGRQRVAVALRGSLTGRGFDPRYGCAGGLHDLLHGRRHFGADAVAWYHDHWNRQTSFPRVTDIRAGPGCRARPLRASPVPSTGLTPSALLSMVSVEGN